MCGGKTKSSAVLYSVSAVSAMALFHVGDVDIQIALACHFVETRPRDPLRQLVDVLCRTVATLKRFAVRDPTPLHAFFLIALCTVCLVCQVLVR